MNFGTTARRAARAGFPVDAGNVPYDVLNNSFIAKARLTSWAATRTCAFRFNWADGKNENIEPWGGQVAQSRGAFLDSNDRCLAASHNWIVSSRIVNELRFQFARRDQKVISLDPTCDGECDQEDEGGPTLESRRSSASAGSASRRSRARTMRLQIRRQPQLLLRPPPAQGRLRLQLGRSTRRQSLPLHFGGRYIFAALPAIPGLLPVPATGLQALALGLPAAYVQGYGESGDAVHGHRDLSLFVQDDWRLLDNLTAKLGLRYQNQYWPSSTRLVPGCSRTSIRPTATTSRRGIAVSWDPRNDKRTSIHGSYGIFYDNHITAVNAITDGINGLDGVRTLVRSFPTRAASAPGAPGHRLPAGRGGRVSEPRDLHRSGIEDTVRASVGHWLRSGAWPQLLGRRELRLRPRQASDRYHRLQPDSDRPRDGPAAARRRQSGTGLPQAGTSASVLQYTSWGETWYKGLTVSLTKRLSQRYQLLAAYTLSKAEDTSTDFQSFFIPQDNGRGRDPGDPNGLPIGFNPDAERGASLQDQRHRFVRERATTRRRGCCRSRPS